MSESTVDTQFLAKIKDDSALFGVSIRAWLAILLTLTICAMSVLAMEIKEPLYTLGGMAIGFYLGQKNK